jgi:hypothetical protein
MIQYVIKFIKNHKLSSTKVAYVLGKVELIYTYWKSNYHLHKSIEVIKPNSIVLVVPIECDDLAVFGELIIR